jgi:hypothetical protein
MTKKIEIPEEVVDQKSYIKYTVLVNNPIIKNRIIDLSDGGEVNIGLLPHVFKKKIEHLPPKEQEVLLERKQEFMRLLQKKNIALAQAYGNAGRYGGKKNKDGELSYQKKAELALEQDIITLLGRMFSIQEVVKILVEDNGIAVSTEKVKQIMANNLVAIERAREEFRNKVTDVRLYNKRPRLEELAWMYSKMKMRYIAMNSTDAYNAMLRTLEQIRKEAEGDILNINGAIDVNLSVELQAHIQKEIIKTINIKEIILGRIAARMNYDCKKLVAGLHNSYYNQFVQISGDFDPNAEMQYPSLVNYDFGEIERKNADRDDVVEIQAEPVKEEEHEKASSIRDLFLRKIRAQKEQYESRTSTAVVEEEGFEVKEDYEEIERSGRRNRYDSKLEKEKRKPYKPREKK